MADLSDLLETVAGSAKRLESGDKVIEQQSIKDLIEADRYLKQQASARAGRYPFRTVKLSPPGTQ